MSRMHPAAGVLLLTCGICVVTADSKPPTRLRGPLHSLAFAPLSAPLGKSQHAMAERQFPSMQLGARPQCVVGRVHLASPSVPAGFGCLAGFRTSTLQPPVRRMALSASKSGY